MLLISVVLLAGEIYYRFVFDTTDTFALTKTTERWFDRYFHPNRSGLRDSLDHYEESPAAGVRRVSFFGDSFTAGHGIADVEDRFGNLVRHARPDWEVHVFSMTGWNTDDEIASVRTVAKEDYELDLAVLVYTLNDISDIMPEWQRILNGIYGSIDPGFPFRHSYFLNTLYFRWWAMRDPEIDRYFELLREAYAGPIWTEQQRRLRRFDATVRELGGRTLVVTFPFLHTLGPDYPFQRIHQELDEFWRRLGVPHVDLLGVFEGLSPDELVVNHHDSHPNERAHQLAATAILAFLEEQMHAAGDEN